MWNTKFVDLSDHFNHEFKVSECKVLYEYIYNSSCKLILQSLSLSYPQHVPFQEIPHDLKPTKIHD